MEDRPGRSDLLSDSSALGPGPPGTFSDRSDGVPSERDIFLPEQEAFGWMGGPVAKPEHGRGWSFGVSLLHPSPLSKSIDSIKHFPHYFTQSCPTRLQLRKPSRSFDS